MSTNTGRTSLTQDGPAKPRQALERSALWLGLAALSACGCWLPFTVFFWIERETLPWGFKLAGLFFVAIAGLVTYAAIRACHKAWLFKGLTLTYTPERPVAGQTVEVTLVLPARAISRSHFLRLQLGHHRVPMRGSGGIDSEPTQPQRVVSIYPETPVQPDADDGSRTLARLNLPDDAPTHGSRVMGRNHWQEEWRLELVNLKGDVVLDYDLPVQALPEVQARIAKNLPDEQRVWREVTPVTTPDPDVLAASRTPNIPPGVKLRTLPDAWELGFEQRGWRIASVLPLILLLVEWIASGRLQAQAVHLPHSLWGISVSLILLALALHAVTRQWSLRVQHDGIVRSKYSWLWSRRKRIPGDLSKNLVIKLKSISGGHPTHQKLYYAVYAKGTDGSIWQLTPGLEGMAAAQSVGQAIAQAWQDRQERPSPGAVESNFRLPRHFRIGWIFFLGLFVALVWGRQPHTERPSRTSVSETIFPELGPRGHSTPSRVLSAPDRRLMDAQAAGDPRAWSEPCAVVPTPTCSETMDLQCSCWPPFVVS